MTNTESGEGEGEGKEGIDGFEAIWRHYYRGAELVYPEGQYGAPVIVRPENFRWKALDDGGGMVRGKRGRCTGRVWVCFLIGRHGLRC
jgi:hypothetical protein